MEEEGGGCSEAGESLAPGVGATTGAILSRGLGTGEGRAILAALWEGLVVLITAGCVGAQREPCIQL